MIFKALMSAALLLGLGGVLAACLGFSWGIGGVLAAFAIIGLSLVWAA